MPTKTLDDMLSLLKTALRIVLTTAAVEPAHTTNSPPRKLSPAPVTSPYSEADAKLYALIGSAELQSLTNPELAKRYRRAAEKELGRKISGNAFRAIVNRVRKHHKLLASQSLRKK